MNNDANQGNENSQTEVVDSIPNMNMGRGDDNQMNIRIGNKVYLWKDLNILQKALAILFIAIVMVLVAALIILIIIPIGFIVLTILAFALAIMLLSIPIWLLKTITRSK